MYPSTSQQHFKSFVNHYPPSSYYQKKDHYDRIGLPHHSSDLNWHPDPILIQSPPIIHGQVIKPRDNHIIPFGVITSQQKRMMEAYPYPYAYSSRFTGPIISNNNKPPMIPSKRAAQNRAAQRAFRQRKERHLKDLEEKVKLMDEWKAEIEQLRQENKELKENMMTLERKMHQQIFQQQQQTLELSQQYNYQQTRQRHPKHNYHQRKPSMPLVDNDSYKPSTLTVAIQSQPRKSITRKPKLKQRIAKEKEFVHFYHAHDNLSFAPVNLVSPTVHQETVSLKSSSCVPEVPPLLSSSLAPSPVVFDNAQCQNQLWSSSPSTSSSSLSPPELSLDVFDIPLNTNIQWTDTNTLIM